MDYSILPSFTCEETEIHKASWLVQGYTFDKKQTNNKGIF